MRFLESALCQRRRFARLFVLPARRAAPGLPLSGTGALAGKVRETLKIKRVRADTFGYLQREFMGCVSDVDQHEAREVDEKAVQFALWHDIDGSVTIHRKGDYAVDYQLTPLGEIAAKTRHMPDAFINEAGNDVQTVDDEKVLESLSLADLALSEVCD